MNTLLSWEAMSGIIRHILTWVGGLLVAKGLIDAGTLQTAIGALLTLGGVIFSVISKGQQPVPPTPLFTPPSRSP